MFEIAKTNSGYASAPTTLVSFTAADGNSYSDLIADATGNLFGTTANGGPNHDGAVFEITNSGFVPFTAPDTPAAANVTDSSGAGAAFVQAMASHGASRFGTGNPTVLGSRNDMRMLLFRPPAAN